MSVRNVLVVGAGVAGSTLAYWLARYGIETTVVEKAAGQRSSGSPVDVRGPALPVVEHMQLVPALRGAATLAESLTVVDGRGRHIGSIPTQASAEAVEIPRSVLVGILNRAARAHAEFLYDDSVLSLHDDGHGVDVSFERGAPAVSISWSAQTGCTPGYGASLLEPSRSFSPTWAFPSSRQP